MNRLLDKQFTSNKTLDNLNDFDCAFKFATFYKNKVKRMYDSIQANDKSATLSIQLTLISMFVRMIGQSC